MIKLQLAQGTIYQCTRQEAKAFWNDRPNDRGRIWLEEEVGLLMLADPPVIDKVFRMKMERPGTIITKEILAKL